MVVREVDQREPQLVEIRRDRARELVSRQVQHVQRGHSRETARYFSGQNIQGEVQVDQLAKLSTLGSESYIPRRVRTVGEIDTKYQRQKLRLDLPLKVEFNLT
ncbi:chromosomal replication initiator protein DnaA [Striga asiatica]|uniref:Chromosomal replication initiator protein DnaA n=1 Tax=Striga asiatica TaxID=4170 RepID=A0A5A7P410_STRAF|nr:chromosomal replication initiator protein DnaA [Striga asiatica]